VKLDLGRITNGLKSSLSLLHGAGEWVLENWLLEGRLQEPLVQRQGSRQKRGSCYNWRRLLDRAEKSELVASLHKIFEESTMIVVTHYSGLTVRELGDLRGHMREAGAAFTVTKNRLTRLALKDTKFETLSSMFTGPTGIAYSGDPVAAARVAVNYSKNNDKLVVIGGALDDKVLDVPGVKALATLPSLDELRGKIIGTLNAPATSVAGVVQAPANQVVRVISAHVDQI
tara:strand:- start:1394 stop:2080 length:687 start_codon:yes stop_codon:yes gene_type:complete